MGNKVYADAFGIIRGLVDLKINFMSVDVELNEAEKTITEHHNIEQCVAMSLPLAKDLAKKLDQAISEYEEVFGTVMDLDAAREKAAQGK